MGTTSNKSHSWNILPLSRSDSGCRNAVDRSSDVSTLLKRTSRGKHWSSTVPCTTYDFWLTCNTRTITSGHIGKTYLLYFACLNHRPLTVYPTRHQALPAPETELVVLSQGTYLLLCVWRFGVLFPPSTVAFMIDRRNPRATFTPAYLLISTIQLINAIFSAGSSGVCSGSLAKDGMRLEALLKQSSTAIRLASANEAQSGITQLLLAPNPLLAKISACDVRGGCAG